MFSPGIVLLGGAGGGGQITSPAPHLAVLARWGAGDVIFMIRQENMRDLMKYTL